MRNIDTETRTARSPSKVDQMVGEKVRIARVAADLSMEDLARAVGITWQQIQKYEVGANRIGAGRLHNIAKVLNRPIQYFFDFNDPTMARDSGGTHRIMNDRALRLIQIVSKIRSEKLLGDITKMVEVMARYDEPKASDVKEH